MIYRPILILAIIAFAIAYSVYQKNSFESQLVPSSKNGVLLSTLPSVQFETLDGRLYALDELYKNEQVDLLVVHYWGTWCGPCEAELPALLSFMKRYENRPGVKFLLVAVNDELIKVQKHIRALPIPKGSITWLLDNKNVHRDQFGTTRVPETYVFSSDKTSLRKFVGPQEWNKDMFFQTFDELLSISTTKM